MNCSAVQFSVVMFKCKRRPNAVYSSCNQTAWEMRSRPGFCTVKCKEIDSCVKVAPFCTGTCSDMKYCRVECFSVLCSDFPCLGRWKAVTALVSQSPKAYCQSHCTQHYTLHTVHYTLHTVHYTPHCTLHTKHCTLHTTYCTPHTEHCIALCTQAIAH